MSKTMVDFLIEHSQEKDKFLYALKNIFANVNRIEDSVFKSGILANIELAVGKEIYLEWQEFYD